MEEYTPRYQPCGDIQVFRAIDLQPPAPSREVGADYTYASDLSIPCGSESSDSEFDLNYVTSETARLRERSYRYRDDVNSAKLLRTAQPHEPLTTPRTRKQSQGDHDSFLPKWRTHPSFRGTPSVEIPGKPGQARVKKAFLNETDTAKGAAIRSLRQRAQEDSAETQRLKSTTTDSSTMQHEHVALHLQELSSLNTNPVPTCTIGNPPSPEQPDDQCSVPLTNSATTSEYLTQTFEAHCTLGTITSGTSNCEAEDRASKYDTAKPPSLVVNHLPQPIRQNEIKCAIARVEKVFEHAECARDSSAVESYRYDIARLFELNNEHDESKRSALPIPPPLLAHSPELMNQSHQKISSSPSPLLDLSGKPKEATADGEAVDGNGEGRYSYARGSTDSMSPGENHTGPLRINSSGRRRREGSGPYRRPPPRDKQTQHSPSGAENRFFPCVFHCADGSQPDPTPDCRTCHRFLSRLRKHHECNTHQFFYCTVCFSSFQTVKELTVHESPPCNNHKCVTPGCSKYNTFVEPMCTHEHVGRKNSQLSIWKALFRMVRPSDAIPDLGVVEPNSPFSPTLEPSTPMTTTEGSSVRYDLSQRNPGLVLSSPPAMDAPKFVTRTPTTGLGDTYVDYNRSIRDLEALVRSLVRQLDQPEEDALEVLQAMYSAYMDREIRVPAESSANHNGVANTIQGLQSLSRNLWEAIQRPDDPNRMSAPHLRQWAHDLGILSQHPLPHTPMVSSPPTLLSPHDYASGQDNGVWGVASAQQLPAPSSPTAYRSTSDFDSFNHLYHAGESTIWNIDSLPYPPMPPTLSGAIDPQQLIRTPDSTSQKPGYMPFTQHDSAAAIRQETPSKGKRSLLSDSAYGTQGTGSNVLGGAANSS